MPASVHDRLHPFLRRMGRWCALERASAQRRSGMWAGSARVPRCPAERRARRAGGPRSSSRATQGSTIACLSRATSTEPRTAARATHSCPSSIAASAPSRATWRNTAASRRSSRTIASGPSRGCLHPRSIVSRSRITRRAPYTIPLLSGRFAGPRHRGSRHGPVSDSSMSMFDIVDPSGIV